MINGKYCLRQLYIVSFREKTLSRFKTFSFLHASNADELIHIIICS